ncbi:MAG: ImmA/IrrE family metallo-endopeptidase [Opitutaceae bacterium]
MNKELNRFKVEKASASLLAKYDIRSPNFDITDLAFAEGLDVRVSSLTNIDAWLVRKGADGGIIRISDRIPERGRMRFSIAHELGHWVLHPTLSQGFLCSANDFIDYSDSLEEAEANHFASSLLIPKVWLDPRVWLPDPSFKIVSEIAKEFGTTLTATAWRYAELTKQPVVLVFSNGGIIKWTLYSVRAKQLFLRWGEPIPRFSITNECLKKKTQFDSSYSIHPSVWFPDRKWRHDSELFEDVRVSNSYGWCLSMLWLPELY